MSQKETAPETIIVSDELISKLSAAIEAELEYEEATNGKRKLGITGEVGELLACYHRGLKLVLDSRSAGFDALDNNNRHIQIKTRRSETRELPKDVGRISRFSKHEFDYALLVLLNHKYELREIWRADYDKLKPIIEKNNRCNPNLASFKKAGGKIFDASSKEHGNPKQKLTNV